MARRTPILYSALMLTAVNLLLRFAGTGFQVYLSGRIGSSGIGLLQLVLSVGSLSLTAGIAGIRTATMYLTAGELGRKRPHTVTWVLSACMGYSILCSGFISVLLFAFAPQVSFYWIGDIRVVGAVRLFAAFLPVNCLSAVMCGYFTAANRIGTLAAVEIGEQLCAMGSTVFLLWRAQGDLAASCMAVVAGSGMGSCFTLLSLVFLRLREKVPDSPRIPIWKRLLQTALPLAVADDVKAGISTTENLMVPKRLSLHPGTNSALSAFGMVCGMVFPVMMFPAAIVFSLAELLIPELARCDAAGSCTRIRYLAKRSLKTVLLYGSLCSGVLFLTAPELCETLYGSTQAGLYLKTFALLVPMLYCDIITDAMTKGLGQQTACVRYNIFTSLLDVVFLFFLLPKWGLSGYFFSFLVTHLINFLLSLRRLIRTSGCRIRWKEPLLILGSLMGSIMLSSCLHTVFFRCLAFFSSFTALLILCGVLSRADALWVRSLAKRK